MAHDLAVAKTTEEGWANLDAWGYTAHEGFLSVANIIQAIHAARPEGGRIVLLSVTEDRSIDFAALLTKELTLIGSHAYGSNRRGPEFAAAVDVLGQYSAELAALQTHQFPLPGCKQPSISPPTRPAAR